MLYVHFRRRFQHLPHESCTTFHIVITLYVCVPTIRAHATSTHTNTLTHTRRHTHDTRTRQTTQTTKHAQISIPRSPTLHAYAETKNSVTQTRDPKMLSNLERYAATWSKALRTHSLTFIVRGTQKPTNANSIGNLKMSRAMWKTKPVSHRR